MELWLEATTPTGDRHEVAADIGPAATIEQLAAALAEQLHVAGPVKLRVQRLDREVSPSVLVAGSGLRFGDRVELCSARRPQAHPARIALVVTGGPAAGQRFVLGVGDHSVGRDAARAIVIDDASMSMTHAGIRITDTSVRFADAGSSNGTYVNGTRLSEPVELHPGDVIQAGHTTVRVDAPDAPPTVAVGDDGLVHFNRPPRVHRPPGERLFKLNPAPNAPHKRRIPMASALGPLVLGVPMVAVGATTGNTMLLITGAASAVLSPLLAIVSYLEDRRGGRRTHEDELTAFHERLAATSAQMQRALEEEIEERRRQTPDMAEMIERARTMSPALWERRPSFGDFLMCRLGTADQPSLSSYEIADTGDDSARAAVASELGQWATVRGAPVVVDIVQAGVVGLCGHVDVVAAAARTLLVHTAIAQSPRDLVVAMAVSRGERDSWSWATWLPHLRSESSPVSGPHFAVGESDALSLFENVSSTIAARRAEMTARLSSSTRPAPAVVLLVSEELRVPRAAITSILEDGPGVSVNVIWLGRSRDGLPGECGAVVEVSDRPATLELTLPATGRRIEHAVADLVPLDVARDAALALAGIRDVTAGGARGQIPRRVSLVELLDLTELSPSRVIERWQRSTGGVDALVGCSAGGPFRLDMRADGPHALIGGTTGAGKSELLQTFVAALAATHPPDRVTFLLVDYKGGAAFKDAVSLPHTVGFVTDLDGHLVSRVLVSLNAELHRREHLLREHGAKDLLELERREPAIAPPSLILIVDEFATLAKELPEFVDGVVNVAQRGRSLGIHLVLATQRPAGAINDNVRANTNLRIALRMNDTTDSEDVIAAKDAALLPRTLPGRAFARTGQAELTEVQIAYVGGQTVMGASSSNEVTVWPLAHGTVRRVDRVSAADDDRTDLQLMVAAISAAAADAGIPPQPQPWLPPLPSVLALESLAAPPEGSAVLGLIDLPARQAQEVWLWDPESDGSLLVYGTSGSGKTTLLRTLAVSLARSSTPEATHIYGLDFSSRGLAPLESLPHVGSVIAGDDIERVQRLIDTVGREMARRRDIFAAAGVSTLSEHRRTAEPMLPRIVVLLDGYAGFTSVFERIDYGEWIERMPRLASEGRALGIHFVISADRRTAVSLALSGSITTRVVLKMAEDDEYASLGLDARTARATALPPGRGFVGPTIEMQVAVIGTSATGEGQVEAVTAIGAQLARLYPGSSAPAVRSLPLEVRLAELPPAEPMHATIGIGQRNLTAVSVDLRDGNLLVAGPNRSGRSTALAAIARSLRASTPEADLYLLAPRRSPLVDLDLWTQHAQGINDCTDLARQLEDMIGDRTGAEAPIIVIVDDGTELVDSSADSSLERIARRGRDAGISLVGAAESTAALRSYSGWVPEIRKDRRALLLNPDPDLDGDIVSVKLPRRSGGGLPPGRGFLACDGVVELVQCAG